MTSSTQPERLIMRPRWARADAYLFDIDGTLLNTRDATHYHAFHHAVREVFGVDSRIDGVPVHGNTDIGILRAVLRREGLTDAQFEAKLPTAIANMCNEVTQNASRISCELCPSITDLLQTLRTSGKLLGVVSGNLEQIGWLKLESANVRHYFDFGCFSDQAELRHEIFSNGIAEVRRRLSPKAEICIVGDTPADITAAKSVGVPVIAVATGIYAPSDLQKHNPDACFSCCTEFLDFFSE